MSFVKITAKYKGQLRFFLIELFFNTLISHDIPYKKYLCIYLYMYLCRKTVTFEMVEKHK